MYVKLKRVTKKIRSPSFYISNIEMENVSMVTVKNRSIKL